MKNVIYPKTNVELESKYNYYIANELNYKRLNEVTKWYEWYKKVEKKLRYICKKNEFFKWYIEDDMYAVQLWRHIETSNYDELVHDIAVNTPTIYSTNDTLVIK